MSRRLIFVLLLIIGVNSLVSSSISNDLLTSENASRIVEFNNDSSSTVSTSSSTAESTSSSSSSSSDRKSSAMSSTTTWSKQRATTTTTKTTNGTAKVSTTSKSATAAKTKSEMENWKIYAAAGGGGGALLLLIIIIVICCVCRRRKMKRNPASLSVTAKADPNRGKFGGKKRKSSRRKRGAKSEIGHGGETPTTESSAAGGAMATCKIGEGGSKKAATQHHDKIEGKKGSQSERRSRSHSSENDSEDTMRGFPESPYDAKAEMLSASYQQGNMSKSVSVLEIFKDRSKYKKLTPNFASVGVNKPESSKYKKFQPSPSGTSLRTARDL